MNARTYTAHLRGGGVVKVTVNPKKEKIIPLPYPDDPPQLSFLDAYKVIRLGYRVEDSCEFQHKNRCGGVSSVIVKVVQPAGRYYGYLLCESCASGLCAHLDELMTPHSNTGSKIGQEGE